MIQSDEEITFASLKRFFQMVLHRTGTVDFVQDSIHLFKNDI